MFLSALTYLGPGWLEIDAAVGIVDSTAGIPELDSTRCTVGEETGILRRQVNTVLTAIVLHHPRNGML